MTPALLLPAGLAALAALLLPLAIHLARRSERRPTDFAALRWLHAQVRPRRNLRFDEWLLLALRLLLVAALALLLARPVLFDAAEATPWIVAAPGVDAVALAEAGYDDDTGVDVERRWLAPEFPEATDPPPTAPVAIGSLLRELDASMPTGAPLSVLVPDALDGADAQRPVLSRAVDWRIVPGITGGPAEPAAPVAKMPTLYVRHAEDRAAALRYLRAAVTAWETHATEGDRRINEADPTDAGIDIGDPGVPVPQDAVALVWLVPGPLPVAIRDWIEAGGTALLDAQVEVPGLDAGAVRWRDRGGVAQVRGIPLVRGQALQWTHAMAPAAMPVLLEGDFPAHLRALFSPPATPPARVPAMAYAPLTGAEPWPARPRALSPWLALLIAGLFLLERIVAANPRRRTAV